MLADDVACNPRNKFPGCVYANPGRNLDLYGDNIEVDYRGNEVTVENFLRVLTGESASTPLPSPTQAQRDAASICHLLSILQGAWSPQSLVPRGS